MPSVSTISLASLRRLGGNFAVYGIGDFLLFGLSYLVLIPILTRYFSPAEYGIVATLTAVNLLVGWVLQFGLPSAAIRFFFLHPEGEERTQYFGSIWLFSLGVSALMVVIFLLVGKPLWDHFIREAPFDIYAGYVIWAAFFQIVSVFRSVLLRAQDRPIMFVIFDLGQFACMVGLVLYQVVVLRQGPLGQVRAVFLTHAIFAPVSAIVILQYVRLRFKWAYVRENFGFALPIFANYVIGFFQNRGNVLIFQYLVVGSTVGVFALGQQVGNLIQMLMASFAKAWLPYLYEQTPEGAQKTLAGVTLGVPLVMGLVLGLGLYAPEIVRVLSSTAYRDAWIVVVISGLGAGLVSISGLINGGIYYAKRSDYEAIVTFVATLINVVANLLLIPHWGMIGAALASVLSGLAILLLDSWGAYKFFPSPLNYGKIAVTLVLGTIILILASVSLNSITSVPYVTLFLLKIGVMVFYAGFMWRYWAPSTIAIPGLAGQAHAFINSFRRETRNL